MVTYLIFPNPNFEFVFKSWKVVTFPYFIGQTIPVVGGSDWEDCESSLAFSVLYYAVPSGGCSGYSIVHIFSFYELAQWWWSKPMKGQYSGILNIEPSFWFA